MEGKGAYKARSHMFTFIWCVKKRDCQRGWYNVLYGGCQEILYSFIFNMSICNDLIWDAFSKRTCSIYIIMFLIQILAEWKQPDPHVSTCFHETIAWSFGRSRLLGNDQGKTVVMVCQGNWPKLLSNSICLLYPSDIFRWFWFLYHPGWEFLLWLVLCQPVTTAFMTSYRCCLRFFSNFSDARDIAWYR